MGALTAASMLGAGAAHAIPSPELVVGTLASASQLVAFLSAVLGGGAVAVGARAVGGKHKAGGVRVWIVAALLAVALSSFGLTVHLLVAERAARTARLEATLLRPAPRGPDGKPLDPELEEMSFREQERSADGLATAEAAALLDAARRGTRDDVVAIDIRETGETERGSLPGALKIRYPDLRQSRIDFSGKQVLLFCHNGNRSGESCAKLRSMGLSCRFIVGGLEKWLAEGRVLEDGAARSLDDLRALPRFLNDRTLLETGDVQALVARDGAVLVDVRYPGEYATGHLPGAINLPMRRLPTADLAARIDALPRRPIVVPCYDRRSCFFGEVLGLEVTRRGGDFRGRYTVPWEYFEPPARPPHIEALLAQRAAKPGSELAAGLAGWLGAAADTIGFPAALLALAALSRLVVLPVSLKAERDQKVARAIAPHVARLKRTLADDPVRRARAIAALFRRHGLTPLRNLLALLFLPILALSAEAISVVAAARREGLGWIADLSLPDPLFIVPAAGAGLAGLYVSATLAEKRWHHGVTWAIAVPLSGAGLALLSAAVALYVMLSLLLLAVQAWLVSGGPLRVGRAALSLWPQLARDALRRRGIVPLAEAAQIGSVGNKVRRLAALRAAGLPVPDALVVTADGLARLRAAPLAERRRVLARIWRALGRRFLAVRSSAEAEDGADESFAGIYETRLEVGVADLEDALAHVERAFAGPRAAAYASAASARGSILVQPMVQTRYAGVLFTEDPAAAGVMLLEMVEGGGDALVSGREAPRAIRFGRLTHDRLAGPHPPFDVTPLLRLALEAERRFGRPQDIEWACDGRRFVVLQSRDITAPLDPATAAARAEWRRIMACATGAAADEVVLAQTEMSELLPRPTRLSLSLVERLWRPGGSVDLAARRLGLVYAPDEDAPDLHVTVFGRLYVDQRQLRARAVRASPWALRRLVRRAGAIEAGVRCALAPAARARAALAAAVDYDRLDTDDLLAALAEALAAFETGTHVEAEMANIAARLFMDVAVADIARAGADPSQVLDGLPPTALSVAIRDALARPAGERDAALLAACGHRAGLDYELAMPRYGEEPDRIEPAARALSGGRRKEARAGPMADDLPRRARAAVDAARRFQILKEDAKDQVLRDLAVLRRMLLAVDRRLGLGGAVFHLGIDEVLDAGERPAAALAEIATARRELAGALASEPGLAQRVTPRLLEAAAARAVLRPRLSTVRGGLAGMRVAGVGVVEGRALVVPSEVAERGGALAGFRDGDIIVSRMIAPGWLADVLRAGGLVAEVGGWLSHMAIVARERGIAMVVGVGGLEAIATGMRLKLHPEGVVEIVGAGTAPGAGPQPLTADAGDSAQGVDQQHGEGKGGQHGDRRDVDPARTDKDPVHAH